MTVNMMKVLDVMGHCFINLLVQVLTNIINLPWDIGKERNIVNMATTDVSNPVKRHCSS